MFKILILGIIMTIGGLFLMTKIDPNLEQNNVATTTEVVTSGQKKVIITGQVMYPGEYIVLPTDTLESLIQKAGGALADADINAYTPTMTIGDYTEFYIPPVSKTPDTCIVESIKKINVNTATVDELKSIGLTASQAASLVEYRSSKGSFNTIEDIKLVSGIGDKTFLSVRDYIKLK